MARTWILQANSAKWDVWSWWEEQQEPLDYWTISRRVDEIKAGDRFALWVSGQAAGVYALGQVTSDAEGPAAQVAQDKYWLEPPKPPTWTIGIKLTQYFFDRPHLKQDLAAEPDFADALILRMPQSANPIPLTAAEWRVISNHAGRRGRSVPTAGATIVTAHPTPAAPEDITVASAAEERRRSFREARLVKEYEAQLGHPLISHTILLPTGERLICDGYDAAANLLIEAKASPSRQDVRMAIGQLFDYRRHLGPPKPNLAVLLPRAPSTDLLELLHGLKVGVLVKSGKNFQEL